MNRTHLVAIISTALLVVPSLSIAQENQTPVGGYCPNISQNLKRGDRDAMTVPPGQVTELQKFLVDYYDLNPDTYISGYFGRLTQQNVMRFQQEQNIVPVSGFVGPLTRAAIARVCVSAATATPSPSNPPPQTLPLAQPTCTLNANPSSITLGQSSTLTWSSMDATGGAISSIGTVTTNGSQSVVPTLTTTYSGTFWGTAGVAQCSTTLMVTPQVTTNASCFFNLATIAHGQSVTAYQSFTVPNGTQCQSQTRTCSNGNLSGTYQFAHCSVLPLVQTTNASNASCTNEWGETVAHGQMHCNVNPQSRIAVCPPLMYQLCLNGQWVTTTNNASCTPDTPQTQSLACPTGQTGAITQTRTSTCATGATAPTWGAWVTTSNTCVMAAGGTTGGSTASNSGSCTYKGTTYAEGQSITSTPNLPLFNFYGNTFLCDNHSWTVVSSTAFPWDVGASICDGNLDNHDNAAWCDGTAIAPYPIGIAVQPHHGLAPLSVTMKSPIRSSITCQGFTVQWGDGSSGSFPSGGDCSGGDGIDTRSHSYAAPGSYALVRTEDSGPSQTVNIRVDH